MASAKVTDTEPTNEPPPGVIEGVLTVRFKLVLLVEDAIADD